MKMPGLNMGWESTRVYSFVSESRATRMSNRPLCQHICSLNLIYNIYVSSLIIKKGGVKRDPNTDSVVVVFCPIALFSDVYINYV